MSVANSVELEQLVGVREVTGAVTIAANLGPVPQLACLAQASSLSLAGGNDYSAMTKFQSAAYIVLMGGAETVWPDFAGLEQVEFLDLQDVDQVLSMSEVEGLTGLHLSSSSAPDFAGKLSILDGLSVGGEQGDYSSLDGIVVRRLSVSGFMGTELPVVAIETLLDIYAAPNVAALPFEFGAVFPAQGPTTLDEESGFGLHIQGTGLADLSDLAGITTYTARGGVHESPALKDISALTGVTVALEYEIPPEYVSFGVSDAPQLCLTHAEDVAATMAVPTFVGLYSLNDGC